MGLVDSDLHHRQAPERRQHTLRHQTFRRNIEQANRARRDAPPSGHVGFAPAGRVDGLGGEAVELEGRHLILHQGHQRRDDDGQAVFADQGRDLIAQGLARARGHDREHVGPRQDIGDDLFLAWSERGIAEHLAEDTTGPGIGRLSRHGEVRNGAAGG